MKSYFISQFFLVVFLLYLHLFMVFQPYVFDNFKFIIS